MVQGQTRGVPETSTTESEQLPLSEAAIRDEMTRVLTGHEFRASKRSQEFLRFVVDHTLHGRADLLKERTIGIEVFGRSPSYDPSEDATVRVKAGEVRRRLGLYYAGEGMHNPIRIDLPPGSYVPDFKRNEVSVAATPATEPETVAVAPAVVRQKGTAQSQWSPRRTWAAVMAAAVLVLAAVGVWLWRGTPATSAFDRFWAPVLPGSAPVSICAAYVPLLGRDPNAKGPATAESLTLFSDQFVGGGDMIAVSRLSALLTRSHRSYRLRIGNEISLHDLEAAPAVMVGYSHTRWKEINSELRFFIDATRNPVGITDNGTPTKWVLPHLPADMHTNEDYAIVSRVFHPDTHAMLIGLAGITQYGTEAASDLVTNPDLLAEALQGAPVDWWKRNLQLVLHVKVIAGAPSSPRVVAAHFW